MKEKVLLIDAGHGGLDPFSGEYTTNPRAGKRFKHKSGKFHKGPWFYEGVSNRDIAAEFIAQATRAGFLCVPFYEPSKDASLMRRIRIVNDYHQKFNKNCIFISFHSNAFKGVHRGFQIYHYKTSSAGRSIAEAIAASVLPVFEDYGSIWPFGSVRPADFAVLRATKMPSVLLENGFFDNIEDAKLLLTPEFIADLVGGVVNGLTRLY